MSVSHYCRNFSFNEEYKKLDFYILGLAYSHHSEYCRGSRRYGASGSKNVLQHLPGVQEPYKPNYGKGHFNTDVECHFFSYGKSSSKFSQFLYINHI